LQGVKVSAKRVLLKANDNAKAETTYVARLLSRMCTMANDSWFRVLAPHRARAPSSRSLQATLLKPHQLNVPAGKFAAQFGAPWDEALASGLVLNAMDACASLGLTPQQMDDEWAKCKAVSVATSSAQGGSTGALAVYVHRQCSSVVFGVGKCWHVSTSVEPSSNPTPRSHP